MDQHRAHVINPAGVVGAVARIWDYGDGVYIYDTDGKRYFDLSSQLVCCNLGHRRKEVADKIAEAVHKTSYSNLYGGGSNEYIIECARKLAEITPGDLNHSSRAKPPNIQSSVYIIPTTVKWGSAPVLLDGHRIECGFPLD